MYKLSLHNNPVHTVFELLGEKENDITYSIGWALANSPQLYKLLIMHFTCSNIIINKEFAHIRLQPHEKGKGYTDFEIEQLEDYFLIIEAKKGWAIPTKEQIDKYINRPSFKRSKAKIKYIICLSECTNEYYQANSGLNLLHGIKIISLSYRDICNYAKKSIISGSHKEKRILKDLIEYLGGIMTMQNNESNRTYVVSLGSGTPKGWDISWIDIVEKKKLYFHSIGGGPGGWPPEPPNYIAFRYRGKLQSIHHVDKYEVFTNPHKIIKEIPSLKWGPCFLYHLGKGFKPDHEVKPGPKIQRNRRVWCMLDTLLTSKTIQQAVDISKSRATIK